MNLSKLFVNASILLLIVIAIRHSFIKIKDKKIRILFLVVFALIISAGFYIVNFGYLHLI